jgi:hypothetical protein
VKHPQGEAGTERGQGKTGLCGCDSRFPRLFCMAIPVTSIVTGYPMLQGWPEWRHFPRPFAHPVKPGFGRYGCGSQKQVYHSGPCLEEPLGVRQDTQLSPLVMQHPLLSRSQPFPVVDSLLAWEPGDQGQNWPSSAAAWGHDLGLRAGPLKVLPNAEGWERTFFFSFLFFFCNTGV